MKKINILFTVLLGLAVIATSCSEDADAPTISDIEIGTSDSRIGYQGNDIHLQAEILAESKIENIRILIQQEEEEALAVKSIAAKSSTEAWEYDSTYTGVYDNVKTTTFHEHVDIPATADTGTYHLYIYVTDLEGYQTMVEEEFSVQEPNGDESYPTITVTSMPSENETFNIGDVISISGTVSDVQGLAGIYIGIVSEDADLADSGVNASNTITLLHNHDFDDPNEYSFDATLTVGATQDNNITPKDIDWTSGNYYIVVKTPAIDGEVSFSDHYPIVINID